MTTVASSLTPSEMTGDDASGNGKNDDGNGKVVSFPLERPLMRVRRRDVRPPTQLLHFVVGPENRLLGFLGGGDESPFAFGDPILLVGPTGVGKTTLALHFAAKGAIRLGIGDGPPPVTYLPAVDFARRYAEAIETDDLVSFREPLEATAVLVIDDLHSIAHKAAAQSELAARIEARGTLGKPTLVTSRRLPGEVRGLRPRLVSRILAGLTVSVRPPEGETRRLLLQEYALLQGIEIDPPLLELLHAGIADDVPPRGLEAAVRQIELWSRMNESVPTIESVETALANVVETRSVTIAAISRAVARYFQIKSSDLKSGSRRQRIVRARSLAMWLARQMTPDSLQRIGDHFGGRDHSTVLHAIRKTDGLIENDADLRRAVEELREKLSS